MYTPARPTPSPTSSTSSSSSSKSSSSLHRRPDIPPGTQHTYTYLKGRCGEWREGCTGHIPDPPSFSPKSGKFFVRCSNCPWYRPTVYGTAPPPSPSPVGYVGTPPAPPSTYPAIPPYQLPSDPISDIASDITQPPIPITQAPATNPSPTDSALTPAQRRQCALLGNCRSNQKKVVNKACSNRLCLTDCIEAATPCELSQHKLARLKRKLEGPTSIITQPSQPPTSTLAPPTATLGNDLLSQLTVSSVVPTAREPNPRPIAAPFSGWAFSSRFLSWKEAEPALMKWSSRARWAGSLHVLNVAGDGSGARQDTTAHC